MIPITTFAGKSIAVFGLGLSGLASARALIAGGAKVSAWDDNEKSRQQVGDEIPLVDLSGSDWSRFSALVLAPGVPLTHPEPHWVVGKANEAGVEIIGDTELFFRNLLQQKSNAKVVAITGTNGKSTTTALVVHILKANHLKAEIGGNFGEPVLGLSPFSDDRIYVIEFSSFQIDLTPTLAPAIACLLNISPDHLDRHGTIKNYASIKEHIFSGLRKSGTAVVCIDDKYCNDIADRLNPDLDIWRLSGKVDVPDGIRFHDSQLDILRNGALKQKIDLTGIASLRGNHNWQNAAAAVAISSSLGLVDNQIMHGLQTFPGLVHRMEEVGRRANILFINDSKATNADAAAKALASFGEIYWIAGGRAKEGGIKELESFHANIRKAYLIGECAPEFAAELDGYLDYEICGTLNAAVVAASRDAALSKGEEPVVLLSPACASYDQFPSFVVRGEAFRQAVSKVDGVRMKGTQDQ